MQADWWRVDLTIVIVNWNGGTFLMRCLDSIRVSAVSGRLEVILVDNHSTDGSREAAAAAFPEFRVIDSGSNLGFGRGNNLARKLVSAPVVLFLNPDTELLDGTLESALECMKQHPEVGALGCRTLYPDGTVHDPGLQWPLTPSTVLFELLFTGRNRQYFRRWLPTVDPSRSAYVRKVYGGFMMVRKDVLDAAGWFDERYFMYAEDADLSRTILALGWKLYYCSESAVVHGGGATAATAPGGFSTLMKQESINKLIGKYQGPTAAVLHRGAVLLGCVLRLTVALLAQVTALVSRDRASAAAWKASRLNQQLLVLWSLGLRRPFVPVSPPSTAAPVAAP